jgi:hypothetical protein
MNLNRDFKFEDRLGNVAYNLTPSDNTFTNTCPIMVNYQPGANGIKPDTVPKIVAGLYFAQPPTTSFANINLAENDSAHPLPNCRLYYSQNNSRSSKIN